MLEDELLKLRFVLGSAVALARIYQKYADTLLTTCLVNRARDVIRHQNRRTVSTLDTTVEIQSPDSDPVETIMGDELANQANEALAQLPYEQREAIILYIKADMSLKQIAELQEVPMRTVQGRYRRGLEKLRKAFAKEVRL